MKIVSQNDKENIRDIFSFIDPSKLERIEEFQTGEPVFAGEWVGREAKIITQVAAQRTKPGGKNLPKENLRIPE